MPQTQVTTPISQGNLLTWLAEAYQRLRLKSPAFFRVFDKVQYVILLIAGLPTILQQLVAAGVLPADWESMVPERWLVVLFRIITFCAMWGLFVSKLTVQRTPVEVQKTEDGLEIVNITNAQKLPFTAKKEAEIVELKSSESNIPFP